MRDSALQKFSWARISFEPESFGLISMLFWLVLLHRFRYIGMLFLVPDVQVQLLTDSFAAPAAYSDLGAAVLAILACFALRNRWSMAIGMV